MRILLLCLAAGAALLSTAGAQTGRFNSCTSAPVPGRSLELTVENPASAAGNAYYWMISPNSDTSVPLPSPFRGSLRVDPNSFEVFQAGTLKATPSTTVFPIPNDPSLLGAMADAQSGDIDPNTGELFLAQNDVVVTIVNGVGTTVFATGLGGRSGVTLYTSNDGNMGEPTKGATYIFERIFHYDARGWCQGYALVPGAHSVNPDLYRDDGPMFHQIKGSSGGTVRLPTGVEFAVVRDKRKHKEFALITIDRKTGKVTEISGSRFTSLYNNTYPENPFGDHWQFTKDGKLAFGVIDTPGPNTASDIDRIVLVRTDNSNWPGTNRAALILVPPAVRGGQNLHDGNIFLANEVVFFRGTQFSSGAWPLTTLWAVPLDGSAPPIMINSPCEGVFAGDFRVSRDGKTVVFPAHVCGVGTRSQTLIALTNISKNSITRRDITGFDTGRPPWYRIKTGWGNVRGNAHDFHTVLSRDGSRVAFTASKDGGNLRLYVAKTDGSQAGKLKPAAGFPAGTHAFGTPHFLEDPAANGDLLVFAGPANANDFSLYRVKGDLSGVTRLTTLNQRWAGWTMVSDSGWLYFPRAQKGATNNPAVNLVGVSPKGQLTDITGTEFQGGTATDVVLFNRLVSTSVYLNLFRRRPGSDEMYFVAPEWLPATRKYRGDNVWKFDFERGTRAVKVTSFAKETGSTLGLQDIQNLNVRADGAIAFSTNPATRSWPETAYFLAPGKPLVNLSAKVQHALTPVTQSARYIADGSLHLVGDTVAWMQGSNSNTSSIGCFVQIGASAGHALFLTPLWDTHPHRSFLLTFSGR